MESAPQKHAHGNETPSDCSLNKKLAIAAIAASLGVSLGVPVGDVVAAGEKMDSPPSYSRQHKDSVASGQIKSSKQVKLKNQVSQKQSSQIKIDNQTQQKSSTIR
jgi:hypothetical protein